MRQEVPHIEVELMLQPAGSGARSQRTPPVGYCPHFRVDGGEYLGIEIVDAHESHGAESRSVAKVRLLYWPEVNYEALSTGATFEVLEGPIVVGHGRVVRGSHAIWEYERPAALKPAALLMCVFNVLGVLFYESIPGTSTAASIATFAIIYVVVAAVSFVVIWFFWRGQNWARWLVLATSVLALFNLSMVPSSTWPAQLLILAEAAFAVWLFSWLFAGRASRFFTCRRPKAG